ncbi:hypothetical protein [Ekhidna sp.]|uniref:hypothetical protein n=1 Tax=Ekhidna sp. TaxID=2608089 RepID=UPI003BAC412F
MKSKKNSIVTILGALIFNAFIIAGLISPMFVFGQLELTEYDENTIPVPPEEASLGRYAHSPVSLAKGELNLQIPIHTIKGRDLYLPISLSYRQGVKIHDPSEYTGHGWTLFAGGVITRKVNHRVDPHPRFDWVGGQAYSDQDFNNIYTGVLDAAFDVFNYNFNGFSGQFVLDDDLVTPYFIRTQRDWKITISETEIRVITENGTEYIFSDTRREDIDYAFPEGSTELATVAWYLSEIISPRVNERLEITYTDNNFTYKRAKNNSLLVLPWTQSTFKLNDPNDNDYQTFLAKRVSEVKLISNEVDVSKVTFEANILRQDTYNGAPNSYALSKISIFDNPQSATPSKYFDFDIENDANDQRIFLKSIQEFSGDGSESKPPYVFDYKNEDNLPNRTTYKADHWGYYSGQHGGEFPFSSTFPWLDNPTREPQGNTASYGSLDKVTFPTGGYQLFNYELNEYNNTDWDYQEETLELFWDDTYGWVNNFGIPKNILSKNFTIGDEQYVKLNFEMLLKKFSGVDLNELMDEILDYKISIRDDQGNDVFYAIFEGTPGDDYVIKKVYAEEHVNPYNGNKSFSGFIGRLGWGVDTGYDNVQNGIYDSYDYDQQYIGGHIDRNIILVLEPGNYTAEITTSTIDNKMDQPKIKLHFEYHNGNMVDHFVPAGGIRLASQIIVDPDGEEQLIEYRYQLSDSWGNLTSTSSGSITMEPVIPLYNPYHFGGLRTNSFADRYRLTSLTKHIENSWVYYSEVREDHLSNGFKVHKFYEGNYDNYEILSRHIDDYSPDQLAYQHQDPQILWVQGWPNNHSIINHGYNHEPLSVGYYEIINGNSRKIKEEIFDYELIQRSNMTKGYLVAEYYGGGYQTSYPYQLTRVDDAYTVLNSEETHSIYYGTFGTEVITSTIDYEYNNPTYNLPTRVITTNSDEEKIVKRTKFPQDYLNSTSAGTGSSISMQSLKDQNIFAPIEEQIWKGNDTDGYKLIDGTLSIYDEVSSSGPSNNLYKPIEVLRLEVGDIENYNVTLPDFNTHSGFDETNWLNGNPYYNYNASVSLDYYHSGNLKEISRKDGVNVVYVWGYNKQYPIAKIENFKVSEITSSVQSWINTAITASNNDDSSQDEDALRSALSSLRNTTALNNAMVTTYTYDPLIGITSITDPNGYTTYYEYDELNRLIKTKDDDTNLFRQYKYNYGN